MKYEHLFAIEAPTVDALKKIIVDNGITENDTLVLEPNYLMNLLQTIVQPIKKEYQFHFIFLGR